MTNPESESAPPPTSVQTPREIGSTGVRVFPIAFDASVLGWVTGVERATEVLDRFHAAGGTLVSTSDHYAAGRSEFMIGSWLRRVDRSSVVVATKIGRHPDRPGLARLQIENSVDACLERLGTDHLDFLSFDGDLLPADPLEAFDAVDRLVRLGKVRFLSAAHFEAARVRELQDVAAPAGYPVFRAVVAPYSLMTRDPERELLPLVSSLGLGMLARLPLASGFLTGRVRSVEDLPRTAYLDDAIAHVGRRGDHVLAALRAVADEHGVELETIALAWVLHKPGVTAAVVRAPDLPALDAAFRAATISLSRHQLAALDESSA